MTKEEILAKSREENKYQDLEELEIKRNSYRAGYAAVAVIAVIYAIVQNHTDHIESYNGLFSVLSAFWFGQTVFTAIRSRKSRSENIIASVLMLGITVYFAWHYIMYLTGKGV